MDWWATSLVIGTWLTVRGWRRWRQSVHDGHSFPHSNRYSLPIGVRQTLPELDPDRTAHDSRCQWCRANVPVLLADTRLESDPWRLTWRCRLCGKVARAKVHEDALPVLLAMDRAGGMPLSTREVERFVRASDDEFEAAVWDELL
jgi:hypothetical protein